MKHKKTSSLTHFSLIDYLVSKKVTWGKCSLPNLVSTIVFPKWSDGIGFAPMGMPRTRFTYSFVRDITYIIKNKKMNERGSEM
jgi:hypothetical protein